MVTYEFSWRVFYELQQMQDYLHTIHSLLHDYHQQVEIALDEEVEVLTDTDDEAEEQYYEHIDHLGRLLHFPRRLYSSFIVSWYSLVEDELLQLCNDLDLRISITIQDRVGYSGGVQRARKFLSEAADYTIDNIHWQELINIQKIRNKIVHEGGRFYHSMDLPDDGSQVIPVTVKEITYYLFSDQSLYQYLDRNELLDFSTIVFINPTYDYCTHIIEFGMELFSQIYDE